MADKVQTLFIKFRCPKCGATTEKPHREVRQSPVPHKKCGVNYARVGTVARLA